MPTQPNNRDIGGTLAAVTSGFASIVGAACGSGDLLLLIAAKRAASNFTFPAAFTKQTEQVTSGMVSAVAWKWGALADSGATFVCSTSGVGNLLHGMAIAFTNVLSNASPLKGYIAEVRSDAIARCGSLTLGAANPLGVWLHPGFDNVFPTVTGLTATSWSVVASKSTGTGSDGCVVVAKRAFTFANSGAQIAPNSTAVAVDRRRHYYTFFLDGVPSVTPKTAEDLGLSGFIGDTIAGKPLYLNRWQDDAADVSDDSVPSVLRASIERVMTDALVLTDAAPNKWLDLMAVDVLTIIDDFAKTITSGGSGPTIKVMDDALVLDDGVLQFVVELRLLSDALFTADDAMLARLRGVVTDDGVSLLDQVLAQALRARLADDGAVIVDYADAMRGLTRFAGDSLDVGDAAQWFVLLNRLATDALESADDVIVQAARTILKVVDDTAEVTDDAQRLVRVYRLASDAIEVIDSAFAQSLRILVATADDSLAASDDSSQRLQRNAYTMDAVTAADDASLFRLLARQHEDALGLADSMMSAAFWNRVVGDTMALLDDILAGTSGLAVRVMDDGVLLADDEQSVLLRWRLLDESVGVGDEVVKAITGDPARLATDLLVVSDYADASAIRGRVLFDAVTGLIDSALVGRMRGLVLDDSVLPADDQYRWLLRVIHAAESLDVVDGVASVRIYGRNMLDLLEITDSAVPTQTFAVLYDVRIRVGADQQVMLGSEAVALVGFDPPPELGSEAWAFIGSDVMAVELGGYN